jgi:hypothetical protein
MADIEANAKGGAAKAAAPEGVLASTKATLAAWAPAAGWCSACALAVALAGVMSGGGCGGSSISVRALPRVGRVGRACVCAG